MNLLIINDYGLEGGGAEVRIKLLVEELRKRKWFHEIHVLQHSSVNVVHSKGIRYHTSDTLSSGVITQRIIQEHNISLVQIHHLAALSTRPIIAAKKLQKPVIFFAHDFWPICGRRSFYSKWNFLCKKAYFPKCVACIGMKSYLNIVRNKHHLNLCDLGIAPSQFCIDLYEKHGVLNRKWLKVPPWIDASLFNKKGLSQIKKEKNTILYVGPLTSVKGADLIAEAFSYVQQQIPGVILRFIGSDQDLDNPHRKHIERILCSNGTLNNVQFLGKKTPEELKYEYARASVVVSCPLHAEMFGQTWAQALACGTQVIGTAVGSIPELMRAKGHIIKPNVKMLGEALINSLKKTVSPTNNIFTLEQMIQAYTKNILPLLDNKA